MREIPPALGLSGEQITDVLASATKAPSLQNSQPWEFRVEPDRVELHPDLSRALPAFDPEHRELLLSCGAALYNLRLALEAHDVVPAVSIVCDGPAGVYAVIRVGERRPPTADRLALAAAIPQRHTNRRPFGDYPVPRGHLAELTNAARSEQAGLTVLDTAEQRAVLRRMITRAHREQLADPAFVAEFNTWSGRTHHEGDGIPVEAGGPLPELQDQWVLRDFTAGHGTARIPGKDFEPEPCVAILHVERDDPAGHLRAGQATQAVLLRATVIGLVASFLSQPIEVPHIRDELRELVGGMVHPQTVLRLGFGTPTASTPRRPVADVIQPTTSAHPGNP